MPDITMCEGHGCPKQAECYRATAEETLYRQAFFVEVPYIPGMGCEMFMSNLKEKPDESK